MKNGILVFNRVLNRYNLSFYDGEYFELHCGDKFFYSPDLNDYITVRIEYDNDWYLIDSNDNRINVLENMIVRK